MGHLYQQPVIKFLQFYLFAMKYLYEYTTYELIEHNVNQVLTPYLQYFTNYVELG